jgi:hypothetical protein
VEKVKEEGVEVRVEECRELHAQWTVARTVRDSSSARCWW